MEIINCTAHEITVVDGNGEVLTSIPPSGLVVRCSMTITPAEPIVVDGVGVATSRTVYGPPEGIPAQVDGVFYVVSALVKNASARTDLLVPAEMLFDENRKPIGCRSLGR